MTLTLQALTLNSIKNVQNNYQTDARPKEPYFTGIETVKPKYEQLNVADMANTIKKVQTKETSKMSFEEVFTMFMKGALDPRVKGEINLKTENDKYKIYVAEIGHQKFVVFEHENLKKAPGHISGTRDKIRFTYEEYDNAIAGCKAKK